MDYVVKISIVPVSNGSFEDQALPSFPAFADEQKALDNPDSVACAMAIVSTKAVKFISEMKFPLPF